MVRSHFVDRFSSQNGLYLYQSSSNEAYENLAREEYLFDNLPEGARGFLLYVDSPSIVFGKHQNPWRECSVAALRERGIPLARRISGGGTVYHDLGNLNFSFLLPKEGFDRRHNLSIVARALERLGIEARISDRHDLMVGQQKISGNAFCFRRERALHHGTLLVSSELDRLRGALVGMPRIATFAVESNPASVANLRELRPGLDIPTVSAALIEEVASSWDGDDVQIIGDFDSTEVRRLTERNRSREWIFDRTPKFTITLVLPAEFQAAGPGAATPVDQLKLIVDKGRILPDSFQFAENLSARQAALLSTRLDGIPFEAKALADALVGLDGFGSLVEWLRSEGF